MSMPIDLIKYIEPRDSLIEITVIFGVQRGMYTQICYQKPKL